MTGKPVVIDLFHQMYFYDEVCNKLGYTPGYVIIHEFPDEEVLIKIESCVKNNPVIIIASLDRPNHKIAPLIFTASTLKDLGASKIILVAPYLAYMRQDKQFHEGEGITSKYFAKLISTYFDGLITMDPHLHRWHDLSDIYNIPTQLLHAAAPIANWVNHHIDEPVFVGPDQESTQWVSDIATKCDAPYLIVEKIRKGDTLVTATIPELELYQHRTPVIIDDIISTGVTMIETIKHIQSNGIKSIYCMAVHAIFADLAYQNLLRLNIKDIVTCNTVQHPSNKIDLSHLLIDSLPKVIEQCK